MVAVAGWFGTDWLNQRTRSRELAEAREALSENRYAVAQRQLERLAARWSNDGEICMLLGECQAARGRR